MKKMISMLFTGMFLVIASAFGQPTGSTYVEIGNKYLAPGFGDVLCDDTVLQPGFDLYFANGFYGGGWFSHSFNGHDSDGGEEGDGSLGWSGILPERFAMADGVVPELDVNLTYFDVPTRLSFGKGDIWALSTTATCPIGNNWSLSSGVTHYQPLPNSGFSGAWLFGYGLERKFDLGSDFSVTTETKINYGRGFDLDSGFVLNPDLTFEYQVSDRVVWSIKMNSYVQFTDDQRGNNAAFLLGVTNNF